MKLYNVSAFLLVSNAILALMEHGIDIAPFIWFLTTVTDKATP
jgi:hypothetical protein